MDASVANICDPTASKLLPPKTLVAKVITIAIVSSIRVIKLKRSPRTNPAAAASIPMASMTSPLVRSTQLHLLSKRQLDDSWLSTVFSPWTLHKLLDDYGRPDSNPPIEVCNVLVEHADTTVRNEVPH